jgi:hypothetical protein
MKLQSDSTIFFPKAAKQTRFVYYMKHRTHFHLQLNIKDFPKWCIFKKQENKMEKLLLHIFFCIIKHFADIFSHKNGRYNEDKK